jgi:hypothetical protein
MAEQPTTLYQLIDARLAALPEPVTFEAFIAARRPMRSWQAIADDIKRTTGIEVTKEVLRRWFDGRISYVTKIAPFSSAGAA